MADNKIIERILKEYSISGFSSNPKDLLAFTQLALQLLPIGFQPLELSPVCPLGTISVVAPISQNMVLTTIRNTEVCSDATKRKIHD